MRITAGVIALLFVIGAFCQPNYPKKAKRAIKQVKNFEKKEPQALTHKFVKSVLGTRDDAIKGLKVSINAREVAKSQKKKKAKKPKSKSELKTSLQSDSKAKSDSKSISKSESKSKVDTKSKVDSKSESKSKVDSKSKSESKPEVESKPKVDTKSKSKSEVEIKSQTTTTHPDIMAMEIDDSPATPAETKQSTSTANVTTPTISSETTITPLFEETPDIVDDDEDLSNVNVREVIVSPLSDKQESTTITLVTEPGVVIKKVEVVEILEIVEEDKLPQNIAGVDAGEELAIGQGQVGPGIHMDTKLLNAISAPGSYTPSKDEILRLQKFEEEIQRQNIRCGTVIGKCIQTLLVEKKNETTGEITYAKLNIGLYIVKDTSYFGDYLNTYTFLLDE